MRNLVFVIWMLGYSFIVEMENLSPYYQHYSSVSLTAIAELIHIGIWFGVGFLLYEKRKK